MTDIQNLQNSMSQYEAQLSQVKLALSATAKGPDRDNLLSLKSDMEELIALTAESLKSARDEETTNEDDRRTRKKEENGTNLQNDEDDPLAREYALFKAELEGVPKGSKLPEHNEKADAAYDIEDELQALEGTKCQAPHATAWSGAGYHNAMVSSIHRTEDEPIATINDIKVRVLFVNPMHKEMLPCPFYLDGACKFSDEQCHYSHGEIVPFSSLREYKEPTFSSLKTGSRALAKRTNNLWHRCIIVKMPESEGDDYRVKFESSGGIVEVPVQDLLPLEDSDSEISSSSDDDDSDREDRATIDKIEEASVQRSLLTLDTREPLGNWERHTRGIGSKLMARMGYVHGTGLGKRADGRVAPVEATVLPAGKSLDHCMELREHAGGEKDFFSAERKIRKQREKMERQREKQYLREKARESGNVFNFINKTLGDKPISENEPSCSKDKSHFKTQTNRGLNVANFRIDEDIARLEKESAKLMDSLTRHAKGSISYNNIVTRYNGNQNELAGLRSTRNRIAAELNQRKNKAKLSIF